ncbi:MAG: hypothetical protein GTN81_12850 [Proteobacteria bacterium]|nr:hypothetical protein [Pseudomonadota bacterium]
MNKDVWVLLEAANRKIENYSIALIHEGRQLSDKVGGTLCAVMFGSDVEEIERTIGGHGASHLFHFRHGIPAHYDPESYGALLAKLLLDKKPCLFLSAANPLGADLMPRVAAEIKAPLVTNCVEIKVQEGIEFVKPVQNGRLHATVVCKGTKTKMATMSTESLSVMEEKRLSQIALVTELPAQTGEAPSRIHFRGFLKADHKTIDISEAEFVLAIGKGIGSKDRLSIYQEFADRIGAAIGVTRRVVDDGILPFDRQIGQTGKEVSSKLIVMCGISGAMEFTKGIERARTKIAINNDRKAPIFKTVDFGVVADLNIIIPQLIKHIDKR